VASLSDDIIETGNFCIQKLFSLADLVSRAQPRKTVECFEERKLPNDLATPRP
jgi:hypothetical protein